MDIKKLEVLMQVIEYKTLTKTAENLNYTQSGITHLINSLENDIGFRILKRGRNGVSLTDEGQRLMPIISQLVNLGERLDQEIMQIKGLVQGNISIGSYTSVSLSWLPRILKEFQNQYLNINVSLMKGFSSHIEKWLEDGTIDIGFLSLQPYHTFDFIPLKRDPIYAVMSPDNPLAQFDPLPLEKLNGAPFLMYDRPTGVDLDVEKITSQIHPNVVFTTNFDYSLISMARQNLGVCLVPGLSMQSNNEGIVAHQMEPEQYRTLGIAVPSLANASPVIKRFIACAKTVLANDKD